VAETTTTNYGWTMPDPGASANTWGGTLNATTQKIDNQVFQNQQGLAPIGSGALWFTATPPANFIFADGASRSTAKPFDQLFAIFGTTFNQAGDAAGTFRTPNLQAQFPLGVGPSNPVGSSGGSFAVALATANLPPHAHPIVDVAHNHGVNQSSHSHAIATGSHAHGIVTGGHAHSGVVTGLSGPGTGAIGGQVGGGNLVVGNTSTAGNLGGNTDTAGNLGGNTDTQTTAVSLNASGTGLSTTQNTGSGTPVSVIPPFFAVNFIIRYQ
jgi:microcystin-dependent protein